MENNNGVADNTNGINNDKKLSISSKNKDFKNYEGLLKKGIVDIQDLLSPYSVDTNHMDYVIVDGMYTSTVMIIGFSYLRPVGWLSKLISYGEGVELNIYYSPINRGQLVKELTQMIGITTVKKMDSPNNADSDVIETSLGHAKYMRQAMQTENEDPYYLNIIISVYATEKELLEERVKGVMTELESMDIHGKRAIFRHESGYLAGMPIHSLSDELRGATNRNALSTGLATTYPFVSSEFCDDDGIFMGMNEHNLSVVIVDIFNTSLYKNANMTILGTSGAGKTFLIQLLAMRNRLQGTQVMIIAPLKGHEFKRAAEALGGQYIKISPASSQCINIMEIRESSLEVELDEEEDLDFEERLKRNKNSSLLLSKIQKLHIFLSLLVTDMSIEEKQYLDDKIIETYRLKGITFDNESLYSEIPDRITGKKKIKRMPVLGDLYELLSKDQNTNRMALLLKRYSTGSLQLFNKQTNIDLNNKYIVGDISELKDEVLPLGMFLTIDLFWDKIKEDRTKKKVIIIDELWNLIGSGASSQTANFILEIFKIIRGYGGSAIGATQDINDFFALEDGKYGKGIINNAKMKIVLQLEEEDAEFLQTVLKLTDEEVAKVTTFKRGHGLFYAGSNHIAIQFIASDVEKDMITTDRVELEKIKQKKKMAAFEKQMSVDEEDDESY